jgi:glycerol-1-phosphate dehydrogenase [NAD(P)+]
MPASDVIEQLLAGTYPDPETGDLISAEARAVVIESSLAGTEDERIAQLGVVGAGGHVAVVSDTNTHAVLGERVERALGGRYTVQSIIMPRGVHADEGALAELRRAVAPATELVVAVGSGTLNDLAKLVAFRHGCPQVVFATAPSMNGYTSVNASITIAGVKTSLRTRTPIGAYFDLGVLAAAPAKLIRSGLGDSACRPTAQADWLLSHLLLDRPYRDAPFALLAADGRDVLADSAALLAGDLDAMRYLVRNLVLSGFGMTICNGSYPASQGEHLLAHYVEMMRTADLPKSFHGEHIAVCTTAMAAIQERVLERATAPVLVPSARIMRDQVVGHFGPDMGPVCWAEFERKRLDVAATDALNERLAQRWDDIRRRIGAVTVPGAKLRASLDIVGAPVEHGQLGWPDELWANALAHAREIRNRYTFLDLVADSAAESS